MIECIDVVVVGAGPVGLLTAIELTLGGARVLVLERLATPSLAMKAMGFGPLADEALRRRGMGAAIATEEAQAMETMQLLARQAGMDLRNRSTRFSGHFGGLLVHAVANEVAPNAALQAPRRSRMVAQPALETMLAARADELVIEVRRECDVTGVQQRAEGVDLQWTAPSGLGTIRCDYLVACDGGRSELRKLAGFGFPGTAPTSTFYQVVAEIDHPERLQPVGWQRTERGVFSYGPLPGRLFMLDFSGPPAQRDTLATPVTRDEIETLLRHISGQDVKMTKLVSASRWGDNTRLADTYRLGRVLLAGDAAHVHSPFGGQGLSLGLVDAANLGWKLAAVVRGNLRGDLANSLLDTYTAERRPAAQAVLANTLAQTALLRPDPQSGALRDLLARLMPFDDVSRHIGEMTSGLATRYDLASQRDDVGRLAGDRPLGQDMTLYDLMQDGYGVFIDASGGPAAGALVAATTRIRRVVVDKGPSLLIRPDACVAWAGDGDDIGGLEEALGRWFT